MASVDQEALAEGYGRPRLEWLLKGHRSAGQDAAKISKWRKETLGSLRRRTTQNNPHGFNEPALRWDRGPSKLIAKYRLDLGGKIRLRPRLEWDRPALYRLVLRTAVKPWLGDTVSMRVTRGGAAAVVVTGAVQGAAASPLGASRRGSVMRRGRRRASPRAQVHTHRRRATARRRRRWR